MRAVQVSGIRLRTPSCNPESCVAGGKTGVALGARPPPTRPGTGIVTDVEGSSARARVQVNFDDAGSKWLVLAFANRPANRRWPVLNQIAAPFSVSGNRGRTRITTGRGRKALSPWSPSRRTRTISTITPMIGIGAINCHQPLFADVMPAAREPINTGGIIAIGMLKP